MTNPNGVVYGTDRIAGSWELSLGRWGIAIFDRLRGGLVLQYLWEYISVF